MIGSIQIHDSNAVTALVCHDEETKKLAQKWAGDSLKIVGLDELEMADYDFLVDETKEAQKVLFPALANTEANEKDAESPLENSNA